MQRRGRLEPYDYPSIDPARTGAVRRASSSSRPLPEHDSDRALDLEGGPYHLDVTGDPVVRERQRPGKGRWEDGSRLPLPSIPVQSTTSPSQRPVAGVGLDGADRSRVMDADGAGGDQEIRSGDLVGREWGSGDLGNLNWDDLEAFGLEDYSTHSVSTAPPPYSQIA
ncbi:hypothetical protein GSI_11193 [Ganoderma sinense ZZ0214-1]|uniref:Uncharacterized protein n=1 Tax=Ganoderma sinense ZZ0214-1 TaxID=1077348 RepID=A0A2G8RZ05_9APHY|nr:hypothetical protein GSI_11193 [Ganoderma sinense ZZ0214-1]